MATKRCLRVQVLDIGPIGPKIDLVLGRDGLASVEDFEEMIQTISRQALAHLGNSRFYPLRGVPWVAGRRIKSFPILGSSDSAPDLAGIAYLVNRALSRDKRVVGVNSKVTVSNPATRNIQIVSTLQLLDGELVEIII